MFSSGDGPPNVAGAKLKGCADAWAYPSGGGGGGPPNVNVAGAKLKGVVDGDADACTKGAARPSAPKDALPNAFVRLFIDGANLRLSSRKFRFRFLFFCSILAIRPIFPSSVSLETLPERDLEPNFTEGIFLSRCC